MKIAQIAPAWFTVPPVGYGGIERVVADLTDGLVGRGHEVTLFASGGSKTEGTLVSPLATAPGLGGDAVDEPYHVASAYLQVKDHDVVHDHTLLGPPMGAIQDGPPVIHTLHGPWNEGLCRYYELLDERIHLVAISETQRAANPGVRYAGTVHNGINVDMFPFRRVKEDFLLFVGRSCRDKGPDRAVRVAREAGMPLVMVVKRMEDFEREYWDREVEPLLTGDERILENVGHDEKVDLMGRARALLFPIDWEEPFGLVMVEAMACGTPVLASPRGAATEVVAEGETGFLCPTLEEMAGAVARIRQISPSACRDRVARHFSSDAMVRGYEEIYRRVLGERDGPGRLALSPGAR